MPITILQPESRATETPNYKTVYNIRGGLDSGLYPSPLHLDDVQTFSIEDNGLGPLARANAVMGHDDDIVFFLHLLALYEITTPAFKGHEPTH